MKTQTTDILISGAGPVGLMCAYLAELNGLETIIVDPSTEPLKVGRADALNARTLQLLETVGLFNDLYPLGKPCNTSSIWTNGQFVSRQSAWWDELKGCFHKHFLMLGQSHLEQQLDRKLNESEKSVRRETSVTGVRISPEGCVTQLSTGEQIESRFVIGADGSRSFIRDLFKVPFELVRPQLVWAVLDGVLETDFPKVPEIIVFQTETSDVAWIPREGDLDRFYVRMDSTTFSFEDALEKINRAVFPHTVKFKDLVWSSRFTVKESVAERFSVQDRVFLAGEACHIHSVNGGQGLNTGLADAFNLIWKMKQAIRSEAPVELLRSYEAERKPVALSVVETSAELVRATKFSEAGTNAHDYIEIVRKRAGNITGMGVRYGAEGEVGSRIFDFAIQDGDLKTRLYSLLNYAHFTLLVFDNANDLDFDLDIELPEDTKILRISTQHSDRGYWSETSPYKNQAILVRPDSYIESVHPTSRLD